MEGGEVPQVEWTINCEGSCVDDGPTRLEAEKGRFQVEKKITHGIRAKSSSSGLGTGTGQDLLREPEDVDELWGSLPTTTLFVTVPSSYTPNHLDPPSETLATNLWEGTGERVSEVGVELGHWLSPTSMAADEESEKKANSVAVL
ncbi:hypothetical protein FRB95_011673 [Tulasnella sp. JGI-2019a]|nr:hypothetical protein FRB95_011673 [Tulasnella sp. JGI-2019a]